MKLLRVRHDDEEDDEEDEDRQADKVPAVQTTDITANPTELPVKKNKIKA